MRHADGAQRRLLQVRKLRQHVGLQLRPLITYEGHTDRMSAPSASPATDAELRPEKARRRGAFSTSSGTARARHHLRRHLSSSRSQFAQSASRASHAGGRAQPLIELLERTRRRLPPQRSARRPRRYSALGLGQYPRSVVQRGRAGSKRFDQQLAYVRVARESGFGKVPTVSGVGDGAAAAPSAGAGACGSGGREAAARCATCHRSRDSGRHR